MNHQTDRDAAILWAREMLKEDFLILDTETTGLRSDDEAVSIGVIDSQGEILLDTLLRHTKKSEPEAFEVHKKSWEETREAPPFADIYPQLAELIAGRTVITYCVNGYDERILAQTCKRYDLEPVKAKVVEALEIVSAFIGEPGKYGRHRWQSLSNAAAHFGIDDSEAHSAVGDCRITLQVIEAMAKESVEGEATVEEIQRYFGEVD